MSSRPAGAAGVRAERPSSSTALPRVANSVAHQAALAYRLTARDGWLLRMAHEHRVAHAGHVASVAFPSSNSGRQRLRELFRWSVLDRFRPRAGHGSAAMHYVLGPAGAEVLAAAYGLDATALGYRRERAMSIAHSTRLTHTVGVNGWFTALITRALRANRGESVTTWWSELRCGRHFGDLVRPDAYGRWYDPLAGELEFFLEYDRGTETTTRVAGKLDGYAALASATGIPTPVLVWLPTAGREATVRPALARAWRGLDEPNSVPVATASADRLEATEPAASPADPVWLPLSPNAATSDGPRRALSQLRADWPHLPALATSAPEPDRTTTRTGPSMLPAPHPMPPPATHTTSQDSADA